MEVTPYPCHQMSQAPITHWGRVTHMCVSKLTIISSDNGLTPTRLQTIIWIIVGKLLIATLGTNFSEILNEILTFSFMKMRLNVSSAKRRPFCLRPQYVYKGDPRKCWAYPVDSLLPWSPVVEAWGPRKEPSQWAPPPSRLPSQWVGQLLP